VNKFLFIVVTLATAVGFAGDKDFNGRWNLTVEPEARGRAWWLEVKGAGGKNLEGRFVGAPGGQMDMIPEIAIADGELRWAFAKGGKKQTYTARIEKDALIGRAAVDGNPTYTFRGERAPEIRDKDQDFQTRGRTVNLMADLGAWEATAPGRPMLWMIADGILKNGQKVSDIKTKEKFWNFELHAEFRYEKGSNSGIGLRGRYEVQIEDTFGKAPDPHSLGALYSRIAPSVQAAYPPGQWQTFDVRLVGRTLTVIVNGKTVIDRREAEGPTAMGFDPNESQPGPIAIQGDHGPVEFRKLTVTPLTR
jgi:hypothetical protein